MIKISFDFHKSIVVLNCISFEFFFNKAHVFEMSTWAFTQSDFIGLPSWIFRGHPPRKWCHHLKMWWHHTLYHVRVWSGFKREYVPQLLTLAELCISKNFNKIDDPFWKEDWCWLREITTSYVLQETLQRKITHNGESLQNYNSFKFFFNRCLQ